MRNGIDLRRAPSTGLTITPSDIARRRFSAWNGIEADSLEITRLERFEYVVTSPFHLLIISERAERDDGESVVEGGHKSTLREFSHKLSFIPAGRRFSGWQYPRILTRCTYLYLDPNGPLLDPELRFSEIEFKPRLFFFDRDIWETAFKLRMQVENPTSSGYAEALGLVLAHELVRLHQGGPAVPVLRGGLAGWQKKRVSEYIEERLNDEIPLRELAAVAQLSPYHFARAFKQSFGMPPHRYHMSRRMERAKTLLDVPARSVTDVGLMLGFAETSSFTSAFRRSVGTTPSDYRRRLV
jgi:AraC family transcriptional regulator